MSLWTSSVITLLLLQAAPAQAQQAQQANVDSEPGVIEEATTADQPRRLVLAKKDWDLTRAYFDVFSILSDKNPCSSFYGGPRAATAVFNSFATLVKSEPLLREVSFQMTGRPRLMRHMPTGKSYRLFDKALVNVNGAFYQRRTDVMRKFPADVGAFPPGTRAARALILLHELGHLIQGEDGEWLIPDDGHSGQQSKANTLRIQQICRAQLQTLK